VVMATLVSRTAPNNAQIRVGSGPGLYEYAIFSAPIGVPSQLLVSAPAGTVHIHLGYGESAAGQNSVWSDISVREIDLSKCVAFQDSAGTLPVTAMEQPLGYIKDLSGNGNHFIQPSNTASRPIVSRRVNLLTATATLATQNVTTLAASHVLTFSGTGSVTLSGAATGTYSAGTHTVTTTAGTLTVTVSGSVTTADLRLSIDANLPPYQRVTSSTDYDEGGFPAYAKFDGVDDWLESGVVDMTSTDEVTVLAGVTKLSDAAAGVVLESSSGGGFSVGSIAIYAPSAAAPDVGFRTGGNISPSPASVTSGGMPAPAKCLLAGIGRISTDTAILRVNGVQAATSAADQGTGNYAAQKFYMGRRGGVSLSCNGRIYGVTVVGKLLTDSQLAAAERAERNLGRLY